MNFIRIYIFLFIATVITFFFTGCALNYTPQLDPAFDILKFVSSENKLPINAGIYLGDDYASYKYLFLDRSPMFNMSVGPNFSLIWSKMSTAMFSKSVAVNSLPPYANSIYKDVEVVIKPEILSFCGNLSGREQGSVEAEIEMRLTVYDRAGNIIWQKNAIGKHQSKTIDYWKTFVGYWTENAVQYAIFSASEILIRQFNRDLPWRIGSLVAFKRISGNNKKKLLDSYYEYGMSFFEKGLYHEAYEAFSKAESLHTQESEYASYHKGLCAIYIERKQEAINIFNTLVQNYPNSEHSRTATILLGRLKKKKTLGIVVYQPKGNEISDVTNQLNRSLAQAIVKNPFYEYLEVMHLRPPAKMKLEEDMIEFLNRCNDKGIDFVVYASPALSSKPASRSAGWQSDVGEEKTLKTDIQVFPTGKKNQSRTFTFSFVDSEITIERRHSRTQRDVNRKTNTEVVAFSAVKNSSSGRFGDKKNDVEAMSSRTSARLFQELLAHDIF